MQKFQLWPTEMQVIKLGNEMQAKFYLKYIS